MHHNTHEHSTDITDGPNTPSSSWNSLKDIPFANAIKQKYRQSQRPLIDQAKVKFQDIPDLYWAKLDLADPDPGNSGFKRAKQLLSTSALWRHLNPKGYAESLQMRQAEADQVALAEVEAERQAISAERAKQEELRRAAQAAADEQYRIAQAQQQKDHEDREFLQASTNLQNNKHNYLAGSALQELTERAFNDKITPVTEIAAYAETGTGASAEVVDYQGHQIPIYHVDELPIKSLSTTINYKNANLHSGQFHDSGVQSMLNLVNDPSFWDHHSPSAAASAPAPTDETTDLSNAICMSYVDEEFSGSGAAESPIGGEPALIYAFTHIQPDSLISLHSSDAATRQDIGDQRVKPDNFPWHIDPEEFILASGNNYNELTMRRYDPSTGKLLYRPDYIKTSNGVITDAMLRHAAYFNIPIVDVNKSRLSSIREQHLMSEISHITTDSDYRDIDRAARLIFKQNNASIPHEYGEELDISQNNFLSRLQAEKLQILELEHTRALDYAEAKLRKGLEDLKTGAQPENGLNAWIVPPAYRKVGELRFTVGDKTFTVIDGDSINPSDRHAYGAKYSSDAYHRFLPLVEDFLAARYQG